MAPVLVTRRLALRQFGASDVDNLAAPDGDPEVMRFLDSRTTSRTEIATHPPPVPGIPRAA